MSKAKDLTTMPENELLDKLQSLQRERFDMLMLVRTNALKNNQLIKKLKREIARIKTILHMRLLVKNNARAD